MKLFEEEVKKLGINLSEVQKKQFQNYFDFLISKNKVMNLTAIIDKEGVYIKHFLDSILFIDLFRFKGKKTLCDVGSGAGFPSIPLKILYPDLEIHIIDSLQKRIGFLEELVEILRLDGVFLYHKRAEEHVGDYREYYDIVTARAVANLSILSELCIPLVKKNGYFLAMKGQYANDEITQAKNAINTLGADIETTHHKVLPVYDADRYLICCRKNRITPNKYPRNFGAIKKKPL